MTHHLKPLFLLPVLAVFGFGFISTAQASAAGTISTVCPVKVTSQNKCAQKNKVAVLVKDIPARSTNPSACFGNAAGRCVSLKYSGIYKGFRGVIVLGGSAPLKVGNHYKWYVRYTLDGKTPTFSGTPKMAGLLEQLF